MKYLPKELLIIFLVFSIILLIVCIIGFIKSNKKGEKEQNMNSENGFSNLVDYEENVREMLNDILNNDEEYEYREHKSSKQYFYEWSEWKDYRLGDAIRNDYQYRKKQYMVLFNMTHYEIYPLNDNDKENTFFSGSKKECNNWIEEHSWIILRNNTEDTYLIMNKKKFDRTDFTNANYDVMEFVYGDEKSARSKLECYVLKSKLADLENDKKADKSDCESFCFRLVDKLQNEKEFKLDVESLMKVVLAIKEIKNKGNFKWN